MKLNMLQQRLRRLAVKSAWIILLNTDPQCLTIITVFIQRSSSYCIPWISVNISHTIPQLYEYEQSTMARMDQITTTQNICLVQVEILCTNYRNMAEYEQGGDQSPLIIDWNWHVDTLMGVQHWTKIDEKHDSSRHKWERIIRIDP